jgi:DNA-binding GntR family transcriptional regulator
MVEPAEATKEDSLQVGLTALLSDGQPQRMPLGKAVADWLGDEIVFGRILPGTRLTTASICRRLTVSQTPVREAFRLLNGEGLVRLEGHRGAWVAEIEPDEVEDIYECRAYLQGLAARQSAERGTAEDFAAISAAIEAMQAAAADGDAIRYFRENLNLHKLIAAAARNQTLSELSERLGRRTLQLRYLAISLPGRLAESARGHGELVEAILAREGEQAEEITRRMIRRSATLILDSYLKTTR